MMLQKRLAGQIMKCSPDRVWLDPEQMEDIKGSITKADIRRLILQHAITRKPVQGISRARARKRHIQRQKGRQRGLGKRKGTKNARQSQKKDWINKIRAQKALLLRLRDRKVITHQQHRMMYRKAKGGFFRSVRHIKIYLNEQIK